jgi:hypothetical protein
MINLLKKWAQKVKKREKLKKSKGIQRDSSIFQKNKNNFFLSFF